jgi:hypothetical protein
MRRREGRRRKMKEANAVGKDGRRMVLRAQMTGKVRKDMNQRTKQEMESKESCKRSRK